MLLGRQRDVEMVDAFACGDLRRLGCRTEQRQAAVAEMIAGRLVVDEADDLVAQLPVLDDLVRDEASELARARDQNAFEADAGAPPALERFTHELARCERQRNVQNEEDAPHRLRHLERAARLRLARREVDLHVDGRDDAEDDGEDAADEDGKEVVDA